jgi:hypothetical protein
MVTHFTPNRPPQAFKRAAALTAAWLVLLAFAPTILRAQAKPAEGPDVVFATMEQGREILTNRDEFVVRLSPFDRAARLKTAESVSEERYLKFVGENVLAWTSAETQKVVAAFQALEPELRALSVPLPKPVIMIKTTGKEEGGADYTRGHAIILPAPHLSGSVTALRGTLAHELFHVISRANPEMREKLYGAIGFVRCEEVTLPPELERRRLTNPDAPRNDHCVKVQAGGGPLWAVPILYSRSEHYDPKKGGEFFEYLEFRLLLAERETNSPALKPIYAGEEVKLARPETVSGFYEQIGRNTAYVWHPEEILADNFALLLRRRDGVPSPEILEKMREIFKQ